MIDYVLSPQADTDLYEIWSYLVENADQRTADRVESECFQAFETLAKMPGIGHMRDDLTHHDLFFFTVHSYLVIYRKNIPLEIAAIIHASRDVTRVLEERAL
jgi:plasmid stabilization system protein ParE